MEKPDAIGKYRIDAILGEGAMGIVYKGFDTVIERPVAIKVVRKELLADEGADPYLVRFKREAQAAGRVMHPNIVAVYDYAEFQGQPYIAMEYVDGRSLHALLRQKSRLTVAEATWVADQVLSALACAHGFGVVHRDIKPANIIILDNGQAKLGDFGIAHINASDLTHDGSVVGTPSYMSPEQCRGDAVDHRSDIFSVGVVLYELLSGRKPFGGSGFSQVLFKVVNDDPSPLPPIETGGSAALGAVVRQALAKDPAHRFPSAEAFANALKRAAASASDVPLPDQDRTILMPARPAIPEPTVHGWDAEALVSVERKLAHYIGPMAKLLVRRAAVSAASLEELSATLAGNIPSESGRQDFLAFSRSQATRSGPALRTAAGTARGGGTGDRPPGGMSVAEHRTAASAVRTGGGTLTPEKIEAAQKALTFHIGPIAKIMVRKALAQATTLQDLHDRLAAHIEHEADRQAFRKTVSGR